MAHQATKSTTAAGDTVSFLNGLAAHVARGTTTTTSTTTTTDDEPWGGLGLPDPVEEARLSRDRQLCLDITESQSMYSPSIDLAWVMDLTGSMAAYLREARICIGRVVDAIHLRYPQASLRFAFVG